VIYEGFAFDLDTYLLDAPGVSRLGQLVKNGHATIISSADELVRELSNDDSAEAVSTEYFFEPNATQNIEAAFEEILEQRTVDRS
jgi:hypothetical protein